MVHPVFLVRHCPQGSSGIPFIPVYRYGVKAEFYHIRISLEIPEYQRKKTYTVVTGINSCPTRLNESKHLHILHLQFYILASQSVAFIS